MGKLRKASLVLLPLAVYLALFSGTQFEPDSIGDQRVLVTGASSGIGEQLAYQYAKLGARLVITARRADQLRNVSRTCQNLGAHEVHFVAADMADHSDRIKVVEHVKKHLGGLDHLVLNHAILSEGWWLGTAENFTHLELLYRVNFLSYVDVASKAMPMLVASRGRIGVVSSGFGEIGTVFVSAYSSCKFALNGFFSSLRQELLHKQSGVSVTVVVLGPVASDKMVSLTNAVIAHVPIRFMSKPSEAARAILESVAQRYYTAYFNWDMKLYSVLNRIFPKFFEDVAADVLRNEGRSCISCLVLSFFSAL